MEIRHLRTFAAVAEQRSVTQAAKALKITQSAASQQIAALEKHVGKKLLRREGRGVELNDDGRRLYGHARRILDLVEQVENEFREVKTTMVGTLRIATSTIPAECLLPQLLAEFREVCPRVRESITVSDSVAAAQAVEEEEADVGFVGELPQSSLLKAQPFADDELVLIVPPDHRLAEKQTMTLNELKSERLIVREAGSGSRRCVEKALESRGLSPDDLNIAMEVNSNDAIRAAVQRGAGIAFLSEKSIQNELAAGSIVAVKIRGVRPRRQLYLVTKPDRIPSPPAREFLAFMQRHRKA